MQQLLSNQFQIATWVGQNQMMVCPTDAFSVFSSTSQNYQAAACEDSIPWLLKLMVVMDSKYIKIWTHML